MKKWCWVLLLIFVIGCAPGEEVTGVEKVSLTAEDGLNIVGNYYDTDGERAVILLHMLNRNKADWDSFAKELQDRGISSIAIDLRGHGESGGELRMFSEDDFRNMQLDAKTAKEFLIGKGKKSIAVIGASIGANTAFNFANSDNSIKTAVLLAPGEDYRGVSTLGSAEEFDRAVLVVLTKDDVYFGTGQRVYDAIKSNKKESKVYEKGGHGTRLFGVTDLNKVLVNWLERYL